MRFLVSVDVDDRGFADTTSETYNLNQKNIRDTCDDALVLEYGRPYVFTETIDRESHNLLTGLLISHIETGLDNVSQSRRAMSWEEYFGAEGKMAMKRLLGVLELLDPDTAIHMRKGWEAVIDA